MGWLAATAVVEVGVEVAAIVSGMLVVPEAVGVVLIVEGRSQKTEISYKKSKLADGSTT